MENKNDNNTANEAKKKYSFYLRRSGDTLLGLLLLLLLLRGKWIRSWMQCVHLNQLKRKKELKQQNKEEL
jgi:hypothetical protein